MYLFGGYLCAGFCAHLPKNKDQIRDCATAPFQHFHELQKHIF